MVDTEVDPIELIIVGHRFEVSARRWSRGGVWWTLCDEEGNPGAMEIKPLGSVLPARLTVNGEDHELQPVPKKGDVSAFKPFNKTRQLRTEASFAGHRINIHCRITAKKNKMWRLWFQARRVTRAGSKPEPAAPDPAPAKKAPAKKTPPKKTPGRGLIVTVHEMEPEED
jgi:hypothetical protein